MTVTHRLRYFRFLMYYIYGQSGPSLLIYRLYDTNIWIVIIQLVYVGLAQARHIVPSNSLYTSKINIV